MHSLKCIVNNAGASRFAAVAQKPEIFIKQKNYEVTALLPDELQDTFDKVHAAINEIVKTGQYA